MDKESIKQIVSRIDERTSFMQIGIAEIRKDLNRLNERTDKNEKQISKNTDRIGIILRCGAWVAAILGGGGGITAITLKLMGVF